METTNFVPGDIQRTVQNMGNFKASLIWISLASILICQGIQVVMIWC